MSNLFRINLKDVGRGIITAILASVLVFIQNALTNNGSIFDVDWNQVLQIAISSGLGYLIKNFFSDDSGKILGHF